MARPKKVTTLWDQCRDYEVKKSKLEAELKALEEETSDDVLELVKIKSRAEKAPVRTPPPAPPVAPPANKPNGKSQNRVEA